MTVAVIRIVISSSTILINTGHESATGCFDKVIPHDIVDIAIAVVVNAVPWYFCTIYKYISVGLRIIRPPLGVVSTQVDMKISYTGVEDTDGGLS